MDEKDFLQKLADPITVALGRTETAMLDLERAKPAEEIRRRLESARSAMSDVAEKVAARRRKLVPNNEH